MKPEFKLNDIEKKNIFRTPENYFEQLPTRVMERCTSQPKQKWQGVLSTFWQTYRLGFAGLLLVLGVFALFFIKSPQKQAQPELLASVSETEILNYLLTSERLETADLAELQETDQDLTHYFIGASEQELEQEIEKERLEDLLVI